VGKASKIEEAIEKCTHRYTKLFYLDSIRTLSEINSLVSKTCQLRSSSIVKIQRESQLNQREWKKIVEWDE
jgi:hypothetical protein